MKARKDNNSRKRKQSTLIETYVAQCGTCGKWRPVPSQEQYEIIRSKALKNSFRCKNGCRKSEDVDVEGDTTRVWLEDNLHGLAKTPPGFKRIVLLRESCERTDVYYLTPQGKRLRTIKEFAAFIKDNKGFTKTIMKNISFKTPKVMKKKNKFDGVAAHTNTPALVL
ncbi:hypothetical protein EUTSA_v10028037mg, partial [Eutrema salsugineum]